jgi:hypothetical protein
MSVHAPRPESHPTGRPSGPSHGSRPDQAAGTGRPRGGAGSGGGPVHMGVTPTSLDHVAGKLDHTAQRLHGVAQGIGGIGVGPSSFGVIGQAFAGSTGQHLHQAQTLTTHAAENVGHAATATRTTAGDYQDVEDHNTSTFTGVKPDHGPIPDPVGSNGTAPSLAGAGAPPVRSAPTVRGNGDGNGGGGSTSTAAATPASTPFTYHPAASSSSGGGHHASGAGGGGDRPPSGPDRSNTGHYAPGRGKRKPARDDNEADAPPSKKGKGRADDNAPPPRRSRRNQGDEPELPMNDRVDRLTDHRGGTGGGWALGNGYNHHADLTGPNGPVRVGGRGADHPTDNENIDYGRTNVHHQGVEPQTFHPEPPPPGVHPPRRIQPHHGESTSSYVSHDVMDQFAGRRDQFPGQNQVMGGSATEAMQASGMHVDPNTSRDWMHAHGFASGGEDHRDPNQMDNLPTAGEHGANIRHLQWEDAVRERGAEALGVVPTTVTPTNPINPDLHVYGGLDYTYHSPDDPNLSHTIPIDTTDPQMPRTADQGYVRQQMQVDTAYMTMHHLQNQGENLGDYDPNLPGMMGNWQQQNMPPGVPVHPPESAYHPAEDHLPHDHQGPLTPTGGWDGWDGQRTPTPSPSGTEQGPGISTQLGGLGLDDDRMSVDDD